SGEALGCGAHLTALRRLAVGPFRVEEALSLADLEEAAPEARLAGIIPLAACLPEIRQVEVSPEEAGKLRQGQALAWREESFQPDELLRVLAAGELLGLGKIRCLEDRVVLAPIRVFRSEQRSAVSQGQIAPLRPMKIS
ncbi:MAG TPA: tRNA pseudouridine(55) synthase TruB, partial [Desulfobaccales bacterium]